MPAHVYAIAEWVLLAACDRGMGIWASTWSPPVDEHTAKYTACIDKAGRTMEHDGRARGARRRLRV